MKTFNYIICIIILITLSIINCDVYEESKNPFEGVWISSKLDNTEYQRFTIHDDMTFVGEEYREGSYVQIVDGKLEYNDQTHELTIMIDNLLSDDIYGPPTEGKHEKIIKYTTYEDDIMIMSCLLGGDVETLTGTWNMIEKNIFVGTGELDITTVLSLTPGGTLHYSMIWEYDGEVSVNISCDASYTIEGDQIIVTNSTDEDVLANDTYFYIIVDQGLYFSYMANYELYPFYRAE